MRANEDIRSMIAMNRLKNWEVAYEIGIADTTFSVWLRTELNKERKEKVINAIKKLSVKGGD